jgi:PAS domain S-box-containing protein
MNDTPFRFTNEKLLEILSLSQDATAIYTGENILIQLANDKMIGFWGKDRSVIGQPLAVAVPELEGQPFIELLQNVWRTGVTYEARDTPAQLLVDGVLQTFYFDFVYRVIRNKRGETDSILHTATDVTELNKNRLKLVRTETQLQIALDSARMGAWYLQTESKALFYSPVLEAMFGYKGEDKMTYEQIFGQIVAADRDRVAIEIERAINDQIDYDVTYAQHRFDDDQLIWLRATGKIAKGEGDDFKALSGVAIDVTEQVKAQQQLQANELWLRNLLENAPVGISVMKGREMIIDTANQKMLEIWGKKADVVGKPVSDALPELEGQPFSELMDDVYTSGVAYHGNEAKVTLEYDGVLRDGFYNFVYEPIKDLLGTTYAVMVVVTDVTEQVDSRKHVTELLDRLNIALDAGTFGSTEVDLVTGKMDCTPQFKKCYGWPPDQEFTYADLFALILPDYRNEIKRRVAVARENRSVYQAEYQVKWPDGSIHWIAAHGRARYDDHGVATRMVGMVSDITERKEYEQRRDDFLGVVSHELKTPITSVKANLQLLDRIKDAPENPMLPKLIESTIRNMDKVNGLVDDLLNMRRYGETHLRLEKSTFTLWEMLNLCCNHVRIADTHELIIEGDTDLQVYADEHRIDQVVVNFVNNAVKYAPESQKIVMNITKDHRYARISVTDFGPGIPKEQLPFLFDRYWQANNASKNYAGLGLGLYICAQIIKRHDGQIGVESEQGKGSTFWFTLPLNNS